MEEEFQSQGDISKEEKDIKESSASRVLKLEMRFIIAYFVIISALLYLAFMLFFRVFSADNLREEASGRAIQEKEVSPRWGNIISSDGYLLAATVLKYDAFLDISLVSTDTLNKYINPLCDSLAKHLPFRDKNSWRTYLKNGKKSENKYLRITTNTSQQIAETLKTFPIFNKSKFKGGIMITTTQKRVNPLQGIGDRLVGYSDEEKAFVGIEGAYVSLIKGEPGNRLMQKIGSDWKPLTDRNKIEPVDGKDVVLTIDISKQALIHKLVLETLQKYDSSHGSAILMEVKTGAVRAMVNLGKVAPGVYRETQNYAVAESSDPGSTIKLLTMLALLEDGKIDTTTRVDTKGGDVIIHGAHVRDAKKGGFGTISMGEAFVMSSNTAMAQMVYGNYRNSPEKYINRLYKMNLDMKSGVDIPGEPEPYIPHPKSRTWSKISLPWMSFGYEIQLTPLQILAYYNAVANKGEYVCPYILEKVIEDGVTIKKTQKKSRGFIASKENVEKVKNLMIQVVKHSRGTAHRAVDSQNLKIAGKTGTAQYGFGKGEKVQYVTSFAGFFPYDDPKYSIIITINQPQGYNVSGAGVSAPLVKQIVQEIYLSTPIEIFEIKKSDIQALKPYNKPKKLILESRKSKLPELKGHLVSDAVPKLEAMGIKVSVEGSGRTIENYSVHKGTIISEIKTITLKTD